MTHVIMQLNSLPNQMPVEDSSTVSTSSTLSSLLSNDWNHDSLSSNENGSKEEHTVSNEKVTLTGQDARCMKEEDGRDPLSSLSTDWNDTERIVEHQLSARSSVSIDVLSKKEQKSIPP